MKLFLTSLLLFVFCFSFQNHAEAKPITKKTDKKKAGKPVEVLAETKVKEPKPIKAPKPKKIKVKKPVISPFSQISTVIADNSDITLDSTKVPEVLPVVEKPLESPAHYDLSVCVLFQNEASYLKEWIEYYRVLGVQHFYFYNDNSHDHYYTVLFPYIKSGLVEVKNWPIREDESWLKRAEDAYNDCLQGCSEKTRWLAILDIDEYIVPHDRNDLISFLKDYDQNSSLGGVQLFWQCFGTSHCPTTPPGKLMIECLTWKAPSDHIWNRQTRSIFKPQTVEKFGIHEIKYKTGHYEITTNGGGGPYQPIQINRAQVNRYWTKEEHFFLDVRIPMYEKIGRIKWPTQQIENYLNTFNQVEDRSILRFVPMLKEKVSASS